MSGVTVTAQGFEVDAVTVAAAFGLDPAQLQEKMRAGKVTSRCEKGVDADAGRFRLTFRHAGRVLRLTVDDAGTIGYCGERDSLPGEYESTPVNDHRGGYLLGPSGAGSCRSPGSRRRR